MLAQDVYADSACIRTNRSDPLLQKGGGASPVTVWKAFPSPRGRPDFKMHPPKSGQHAFRYPVQRDTGPEDIRQHQPRRSPRVEKSTKNRPPDTGQTGVGVCPRVPQGSNLKPKPTPVVEEHAVVLPAALLLRPKFSKEILSKT